MNRIKRYAILLAAIIFAATGFAQNINFNEKLPLDQNFKVGKLENGMTYYIRKAENPKGKAEFFIVHNVGSLQENDDQRGLAHFLEHMAFNGTKHFPDKRLLEYFGSIGVKFGANINAYTSMERTVYNISAVPIDRSVVIDSALLALHDWSHYISCEPEEIEAERGVVREEWRRGDDARTRMMKGISRMEQTGSRFAQRDVIGLPEIINTFSRQTLVDYYHKWYRPDLQAVVIVGDIDVNDIEKRIIERFSPIPSVKNGAVRENYSVPDNKKPIVGYHTDPETKALSVRMTIKIPHLTTDERYSYKAQYDDLTKALFLDMFRVRAQVAAESTDSLFRALVPVYGGISYASGTFTTTALPINNKGITNALKGIFIEVERARQHGFDSEEFAPALERVKRQLDANYNRIKKLKNSDYVSFAVDHFTREYPLLDIDANYKLSKELVEKITVEDVNNSLDRILSIENRVIIFAVPESDKEYLPTEDQVLALLDEIKGTSLDKFIPLTEKEMVMKALPASGKITKERTLTSKDLNIEYEKSLDSTVEWTLENGSKVIWKEEKGKEKSVRMRAFRPGGYALPEDLSLARIMDRYITNFHVNGFNKNELSKWASSKGILVKPSISMRYNEFSGSFETKEPEEFFKLLHMYFTQVAADAKDLNNTKTQLLRNIRISQGEVNTFKDSVTKLKYDFNPLTVPFTEEFVSNITAEKLTELYYKHFGNPAGYTFVFTGPMDAIKGKPLVEKYIASLNGGKYKAPSLKYKESEFREGEVSLRFKAKDMLSTKASVSRIYSGEVDYSPENGMMAKFLTYILRDRYMKSIREEKGGTYHVGVTGEMSRFPDNSVYFSVDFDTDPALVDELLEIVQLEIDQLVATGPTQKEMREIKLYLEKVYNDQIEETPWLSIISDALRQIPDIATPAKKLVSKMEAEEIHKFAKRVFTTGNRMTFVFEPVL
ncbi:MAG: hypothetical protein CVU12_03450 [Bacteroidetes bacterium HGW-Bacteroidetes-7]|jgi:zinc protease|nr:MAG: hypothetical protein CVU12_03450 [Bacteroidetes bacterium HGW-Bacteroidetes-7]